MRVIASFAMVALLTVGVTRALSHQAPSLWDYPFNCCSGADCAQIEAEAVREVPSGFVVTIAPGRHPMWPKERRAPLRVEIPHEKAQRSPDGHWHLCINDAGELLCFFAPAGDS
ncbi:hypothetical protein ARD30_12395 [Bosea thiooxidans]|uniref:Uncharacterized protein n=1 Tax=Bosea thiooxidans TaxID=53254 RepID=A0A0Q3PLS8_9HYPH|nr:hypothetical protein [Bosea thiooxidans]KQK30742.1 hypothetical protein ARD30_12395 [Bosea thiooxidans]SKC08450.1 hypothetical protein SAMN05660750_04112 [Bosea thiooxidans]